MTTPDFDHTAMRPDMITDTEVEISTEDCCEEEEEIGTPIEDPEPEPENEPTRKRKGRVEKALERGTAVLSMFLYRNM